MALHISSIVCSDSSPQSGFTVCISSTGHVYSLGKSEDGATGHTQELVFLPTIIPSLQNIRYVSCGSTHTVCLDVDGNLYTFGSNEKGQLGIDEKIIESFTNIPHKLQLPPIKQMACSGYFTVCLSENGDIYHFGDNYGFVKRYGITKMEDLKDIDFIA